MESLDTLQPRVESQSLQDGHWYTRLLANTLAHSPPSCHARTLPLAPAVNAHSHLLSIVLGNTLAIPVSGSTLTLGTWQVGGAGVQPAVGEPKKAADCRCRREPGARPASLQEGLCV